MGCGWNSPSTRPTPTRSRPCAAPTPTPRFPAGAQGFASGPAEPAPLPARLAIPLILAMSLVVFGQAAGESSVRTFLNVYLDQALGVSTAAIGTIAAVAALVGAGLVPSGRWVEGEWVAREFLAATMQQ